MELIPVSFGILVIIVMVVKSIQSFQESEGYIRDAWIVSIVFAAVVFIFGIIFAVLSV